MGMKATATPWQMTARGDRLDWPDDPRPDRPGRRRDRLLGPAPGRRGGRGRLWWNCPFHDDKNPSFARQPDQADLDVLRVRRTWGRRRAGDEIETLHVSRGRGPPGRQARPLGEADPPEAPGRQPARQGPPRSPPSNPRGCPWPMPSSWWRTPPPASGRPREGTPWPISEAVD